MRNSDCVSNSHIYQINLNIRENIYLLCTDKRRNILKILNKTCY